MKTKFSELEKKLISKKNRFKLSISQISEIKKKFKNQNILIYGAAGSIGEVFVLSILNYKFKKIYLVDKNENQLVDLNRSIILRKKKLNVEYICSDINNFNLNKFLFEKKINMFLNFAAIKHVRSEENNYSLEYLFKTNCKSCFNFKQNKFLKNIFFISTDKACNPSSLMGVSKNLMEQQLFLKKKGFKNIFVSSVRFANVSFSNGSVLKMIVDKIKSEDNFGIPKNIYRFFITHEEAVSLCLKSLLKICDGMIVIPKERVLIDQLSIYELLLKILKLYNVKFKIKKNTIFAKNFRINLIKNKIMGQKEREVLFEENETNLIKNLDQSTLIFKPIISYSKLKFIKKFNLDTFSKKFKRKIFKYYKNVEYKNLGFKISQKL